MSWWTNLTKKEYEDDDYPPLLYFPLFFKAHFYLNKKPHLCIDILETHPYALDGEVPFIFIDVGYIQFMLEWEWLYKILYKRKNGYAVPYFKEEK